MVGASGQVGAHTADCATRPSYFADAVQVSREAAARGVEAAPLSAYFMGREKPDNALVLGFAAVRSDAARRGVQRLAAAIEAARRR